VITKEYISQAVRTESIVGCVVADAGMLYDLLRRMCADGETLDLLKKSIFYVSSESERKAGERVYGREVYRDDRPRVRFQVNPRIVHAAIGKATEALELLDAIRKHLFCDQDLDMTNVFEELGDGWWYDAVLCDTTGFDPADVMERNIAKLRSRYPEKFDAEKAANRDLATEREILEGNTPSPKGA